MRGSIVKRGRTYSYVISLGRNADGRKRQKWLGGYRTRKEAEAALAKALDQVHTGVYADAGRVTVAEYLEEWLDGIRPSLREKSAFSYDDTLRGYVIPRVGTLRLVDLTATRLRALYAELLASGRRRGTGGLSARTVGYVHRILSHALKDAMRSGMLVRNPAEIVHPPRASKPDTATWTAEQVAVFLRSVDGDRLQALWALLATTGMRRGEALGLKWDDVDLDAGRVSIRRALVLAGYEVVESLPKTASSSRNVAIHATVRSGLATHRRSQIAERLAAGPDWSDTGYVYTDELGAPLHPDRVTKLFVQQSRAAGLPKIRLHDLRHTVATLALTAGIHTKVVQELLGHANVSITLDTYSHVAPELHEQAALAIGGLIFKEPKRSPRRVSRRASAVHSSQQLSLDETD